MSQLGHASGPEALALFGGNALPGVVPSSAVPGSTGMPYLGILWYRLFLYFCLM